MAARRRGPGSRTKRGWVANTKAPASSYAVITKGRRKYPINTLARARNALARVSAHGSPSEKAAVKRKVKSRYPALARRSSVISTPKKRRPAGRRRGTTTTRRRRRSTARRRR